LISIFGFYPIRRLLFPLGFGSIRILMYHSVNNLIEKKGLHPYFQTNTTPAMFKKQMAYLHNQGYTVVPLLDCLKPKPIVKGSNLKRVAITFDDGYKDFRINAFPILNEYGFPSTVFIATSLIGMEKSPINGTSHLSKDDLLFLSKKGVTFGSHTVSHSYLYLLESDKLSMELKESRTTLESVLSEEIRVFSYPYAFPEQDNHFVNMLENRLKQTGYTCGVTTKIGTESRIRNPLFLRRIPVNSFDDTSLFRAKLAGAYNWAALPQFLIKHAKRVLKIKPFIRTF
jgi:peptidoglycan/xylan/chitin deacetylase (PgdA/CDA1 family)